MHLLPVVGATSSVGVLTLRDRRSDTAPPVQTRATARRRGRHMRATGRLVALGLVAAALAVGCGPGGSSPSVTDAAPVPAPAAMTPAAMTQPDPRAPAGRY